MSKGVSERSGSHQAAARPAKRIFSVQDNGSGPSGVSGADSPYLPTVSYPI
jgi:hypothetical protein